VNLILNGHTTILVVSDYRRKFVDERDSHNSQNKQLFSN